MDSKPRFQTYGRRFSARGHLGVWKTSMMNRSIVFPCLGRVRPMFPTSTGPRSGLSIMAFTGEYRETAKTDHLWSWVKQTEESSPTARPLVMTETDYLSRKVSIMRPLLRLHWAFGINRVAVTRYFPSSEINGSCRILIQ